MGTLGKTKAVFAALLGTISTWLEGGDDEKEEAERCRDVSDSFMQLQENG